MLFKIWNRVMAIIGVVYFSGTGTTAGLAQAVIEGARSAGAQVHDLPILGTDIKEGRWANEAMAEQLDQCDAIIFGTPTYMGSISAQTKSFLDAMAPRWFTQAWRDKVASGFTASSLAAGDKLSTFQGLATFAMQMGMIWCGIGGNFSEGVNPNGFYYGAGATASTPDQLTEIDLNTGRHLGKRVVNLVERLN
jgi:multimeric flavodoxin WrbA